MWPPLTTASGRPVAGSPYGTLLEPISVSVERWLADPVSTPHWQAPVLVVFDNEIPGRLDLLTPWGPSHKTLTDRHQGPQFESEGAPRRQHRGRGRLPRDQGYRNDRAEMVQDVEVRDRNRHRLGSAAQCHCPGAGGGSSLVRQTFSGYLRAADP